MTESETPSQILTRMIKEKATSVRTFVASAGANGHKLTISAVSQLCTGKQDFSLATATACAAVLGVSPALFLPALDTIIGTQSPAPAGADETLIRLPLAHLAPSHLNPRRDFAYPEFEEQVVWLVEQALIAGSATPLTALCDGAPVPPAILDLANIADSIAAQGLLQNLVVRRDADQPSLYWIVAGERRYRSLDLLRRCHRLPADLEDGIPCRLVTIDDAEHLTVALLENIQRKDVKPLDEAEAFARLRDLDPEKWTTAYIAERIGMTPRHVQLRLALVTKLSDTAKKAMIDGRINLATARQLTKAGKATQDSIVHELGRGHYINIDVVLKRDRIPAGRALFPIDAYTGETDIDEETGETFLLDLAIFLQLQRSYVEVLAKAERDNGIGVVNIAHGWWQPACHDANQENIVELPKSGKLPKGAQTCTVFTINSHGEVHIYRNLMKTQPPPTSQKAAEASGMDLDPVDAVSAGRKQVARVAKTRVLQTKLLHSPRLLTELLCSALIYGNSMMGVRAVVPAKENRILSSEIADEFRRFRERLPETIHLNGLLQPETYLSSTACRIIDQNIAALRYDDLQELSAALLAARCASTIGDFTALGDAEDAREIARRLDVDMARDWRIDADYLATLTREQLADLHQDLALTMYDLMPAELRRMKVREQRAAILDLVEQHDLRHVPAELHFGRLDDIATELRLRHAARDPDSDEPADDDADDAQETAAIVAELEGNAA